MPPRLAHLHPGPPIPADATLQFYVDLYYFRVDPSPHILEDCRELLKTHAVSWDPLGFAPDSDEDECLPVEGPCLPERLVALPRCSSSPAGAPTDL
eukprot:scaffold1212_cov230-Prasinococcus_capsulatus_cf.AAC.1